MTDSTTPAKDLKQAIEVMETTADFYHQMIDHKGDYWTSAYITAMDLLERIQGLPENSLMLEHDKSCDCGNN